MVDQPLLGWSNSYVAVDMQCFDSNGLNKGPDNLVIIPNTSIVTPAASLPAPIVPPCLSMAPARDENGVSSSVYLVASVVPGDSSFVEPATCGVVTANTLPYVLEYTAASAGVAGSGGTLCPATGSCVPLSASPQFGNAALYNAGRALQKNCTQQNCQIDANVARITAAQIRLGDFANKVYPFLTLGFQTGFQSSDNLTGSQDLWSIENLTTGSWFHFTLAGNNYWMSYPTIAADNDLDIYLGSTWFTANTFPSTVWDSYHGLSPAIFGGQNGIEQSTQEYTGNGNPNAPFLRWGDYNTMIYDPNALGLSKEGSFWQVEEVTCPPYLASCINGGADESTTWEALADPLPYFVGSSPPKESECGGGAGSTCDITVTAPSGLQAGDVVLVALVLGEPADHPGGVTNQ